nr:hypothetical protein [Tanacetum cinerariifolium]
RPTGGVGEPARAPAVRECTFTGFMKCNPTIFPRTEGAKVKFAAATLQGYALTWWNSQVATLGLEAAYRTSWTKMKKLMTEEFFPGEEIQRMEHELWNLNVKDNNISAYTQRFIELALLCPTMVDPERKKIKAYIRRLSENIKGDVTSFKPANLNEAVLMVHAFMEQRVQARAEREVEGKKRKWENFQGLRGLDMWDGGKITWDGRAKVNGTVPGLSPSGNFEKIVQLVPGLLSLTFDGFGFDLWAEIVPELDSLINRASL